jgi:two-component system response regulator HydG
MARVLIVDDQSNMRKTLSLMLQEAGHHVSEAESGDRACTCIRADAFDLVLTDLKMEKTDGLDVLRFTRETSPLTEVILMTGFGTVETAVSAMRLGAYDYLEKPFTEAQLMEKVEQALERRWSRGEDDISLDEIRKACNLEEIIGRSPAMRKVLVRIAKIAPTDTTVLITGESGTGKELVAKAIHANSLRTSHPYVPVNCAAITEQLLESELFGHVKGSFTDAVANRKGLFEEANGGTFFFDEIADTSPSFQAKLLRTIQDREIRRVGDNVPIKVDARIIAATNQNLKAHIKEKRFRQDLYYRLNVARIRLPALRDRRGDIPMLVEHFLAKFGKRLNTTARVTEEVREFLMGYEFPGNVRELENMMEQGVALADDGWVHIDDILPESTGITDLSGSQKLADVVSEAERHAIQQALRQESNMEQAAARLGLSTTTLWRKMKRLNIKRDED